jgi:hypothetical protein
VTDKIDFFWCWFALAIIVSLCLALVPLFYKKGGAIQSDKTGLLTSNKYTTCDIRMKKKFGVVSVGLGVLSVFIGLFCGVNILISLVFGASLAFVALPNLLYGSLKEAYSEDGGLRISFVSQEAFVAYAEIKRAYIYCPKGRPGEVVFIKLKKSNTFGRSFSILPSHMPRFYLLLKKHGIELEGYKYHEGYYRSHSEL